MWFLARAEILRNKTRFALFVGLVALVSFLVFVMTGLSTGLGDASVSGLRRLTTDADLVVFAPSVQRSLGRSDIDLAQQPAVAALPGVESVTPIGQSMVNLVAADGTTIGTALIGLPPDAATGPDPAAPTGDGIVLDSSLAGPVAVGDVVRVQPGGHELTVTGFADLGRLQHTPVATTSLATWQQLRYATFGTNTNTNTTSGASATAGASAGGAPAAGTSTGSGATGNATGNSTGVAPAVAVPDRASAWLVRTAPGSTESVRDAVTGLGFDPATPADAVAASPGFKEETGTIDLIRGFLFGIAALLIGTVFWVLTLQKEGPLAVLRAAGTSRGLLMVSSVVQVAVTTVTGVAVGLAAATLAAAVLPATAYVLTAVDLVTATTLLVTLALVASTASLRRLFTVDPLLSLGRL